MSMRQAVRRSLLRALHALAPGGVILSFHSLTSVDQPSNIPVNIPVDLFESVLDIVRDFAAPVALGEFLRRAATGARTTRLFSVTFDDAYAALPALAAPSLRSRGIPATLFVVGEAARQGGTFWWDRVADVYPHVPPARWTDFEDACGLPQEYRTGQDRGLGPLQPLRQWILARFRGRWPDSLAEALAILEDEVGAKTKQRSMTYDEIRSFIKHTDGAVGVHTSTHPVLPLLSDSEVLTEIASNTQELCEQFGGAVRALAVPFGLFDGRVLRLAKEAGMIAALTLSGHAVDGLQQGALPRVCISRGLRHWRFAVRVSGAAGAVERHLGRAKLEYPDLPSAST